MSLPTSDLFEVQAIADAGRGVVASRPLARDTVVLASGSPAVHVIFRAYRKEVCAQCFLYDRGRTLPVRDNTTDKVFCSAACQQRWVVRTGEVGVKAWQNLRGLTQEKRKARCDTATVPPTGGRPNGHDIARHWAKADADARPRTTATKDTTHPGPKKTDPRHVRRAATPDVLAYLLSGVLAHYQQPRQWQEEVLALAVHAEPYTDTDDLEAHCNSYVQLASILPGELLGSCTASTCQALAGVTSHNAFGIRSGSEEGEEYLGYALYPPASYFNHSCSPNVAKKREGGAFSFWMSEDVQDRDQLCISYLGGDEKHLSLAERRERLNDVWGFDCGCERCRRETSLPQGVAG
ncbi:Histone-lysine N-methyltransferase set-6 [Teratosphaeriaceae sp. CCFEE 6253]|nr:Histone-lysine N-methyltransferase set-6 [Teratosphaeriaceae sp. CCFEE 6253]